METNLDRVETIDCEIEIEVSETPEQLRNSKKTIKSERMKFIPMTKSNTEFEVSF